MATDSCECVHRGAVPDPDDLQYSTIISPPTVSPGKHYTDLFAYAYDVNLLGHALDSLFILERNVFYLHLGGGNTRRKKTVTRYV